MLLLTFGYVVRFEGGGGGQNGIQQYPTLSHIGGPFSLKETFLWFDFLLASLDCYTWSFGERLLSPSQVFTGEPFILRYFPVYSIFTIFCCYNSHNYLFLAPKDGKKFSVLFKSLNFFLSKLAMLGITAASNCYTAGPSSSKAEIFSPKEIDSYNRYDTR